MDMTLKAFNDIIRYHAFFMAFFPIPLLINLYTLFTYKTYKKLITKLWFVMPIIFLLSAIGSFTGLFILAMAKWEINLRIWLMIGLMLFIFIAEIMRLRRQRLAKTSEALMLEYIRFCKIIYGVEFVGVCLFCFRVI